MSTTGPVFALRQLQEKCREKNNDLHMVFVDLEKAFDRIPRDLIWWCLRKKGVPEYVRIVQDMYRSCKTKVVHQKGETEYFAIEVGLHQGSALSPLLAIIITSKEPVCPRVELILKIIIILLIIFLGFIKSKPC